ncbi:sigma-54-dependent transcriptional regulator [Candidatus Laterigemmans baculatus]|uniref:sigma-54-dependent transcriptional regulator n=1 Tax=Candidatus Laterigemmans baculatus TaxID=2770505 RepID=UPI0013DBD174|nr:sigma-54 dependent transcriptional regulator [Candidatus Laterigemmans baculatus]
MTHRILIADDEPLCLRTTGELLRKQGYDCVCVTDAVEAMECLRREEFDLVLSDLNMPGNLKLELLHDHSRHRKHIPLIVITGVPSLPTAIESIRLGIADYLLKPVKFEDLLSSVRRAIENSPQRQAAAAVPRRTLSELQARFPQIVGDSPPMAEVLDVIDRVAGTDTNVLITGETGTGKEVVARVLHDHSRRSTGAFQVIDCTAVPETLFESMLFGHKRGAFTGAVQDEEGLLRQCDGGTAFIDELGELPLPMQAKLLRAVQEQTFTPVGGHTPVTVDTRFICATNRDLQAEVERGHFRRDLFYRLGVIHLELPPLRDRGDDVVLLAEYFFQTLAGNRGGPVQGFARATLECFRRYRWPGNIRELRNVIERTVALCRGPWIEPSDLPESIRAAEPPWGETASRSTGGEDPSTAPEPADFAAIGLASASREEALKMAEHRYLRGLIERHRGNVSEAARQAGLSRQGLHKLLKEHKIRAADYRP